MVKRIQGAPKDLWFFWKHPVNILNSVHVRKSALNAEKSSIYFPNHHFHYIFYLLGGVKFFCENNQSEISASLSFLGVILQFHKIFYWRRKTWENMIYTLFGNSAAFLLPRQIPTFSCAF